MRHKEKGFTLVELMVVVLIIGILAAVAVPTFMDYMKRSKRTEASLQLNKVGKNATRSYTESASFPTGSSSQRPAKPGSTGCCGTPNNHCPADAVGFTSDSVWTALDFEIDTPTLFTYQYTGTPNAYTATATGDLDCDGIEITYSLEGTAVNGNPAAVLHEPPPNAD